MNGFWLRAAIKAEHYARQIQGSVASRLSCCLHQGIQSGLPTAQMDACPHMTCQICSAGNLITREQLQAPHLLNNAQVLSPSLSLPAFTMSSFAYHCQTLNQQVPRTWQDRSTELTCWGPVGWAGPVGPEPEAAPPDNRRLSFRQTFAQEWICSIGQCWYLHNFVFISIFI